MAKEDPLLTEIVETKLETEEFITRLLNLFHKVKEKIPPELHGIVSHAATKVEKYDDKLRDVSFLQAADPSKSPKGYGLMLTNLSVAMGSLVRIFGLLPEIEKEDYKDIAAMKKHADKVKDTAQNRSKSR
jgi:hypothetical protein